MNIRIRTLLVSLALSFQIGLQATDPLPLSKQIRGAHILLSDLDLTQDNKEVPPVNFSPTPAIGKSLTIDFDQASAFIKKQGFSAESLGWTPGKALIIARKTRLVTSTELLDHLTVALENTIPNLDADLTLEFLRDPPEIRIPDDAFELEITRSQANALSSRFIIPFSILIEGEPFFQSSAALNAKIYKSVLICSHRINRGEPLKLTDFYLAERDMLSIKDSPMDINSSLVGLESKSTLLKDRPLLRRHTGKIPVVGRGDLVNAFVKKGSISITMKVQVLEKGAPGDVVRVRNPKSKKQLKGIVTDESTIQIL